MHFEHNAFVSNFFNNILICKGILFHNWVNNRYVKLFPKLLSIIHLEDKLKVDFWDNKDSLL